MNNEKIGKFISVRRKELGLTQKELASKINVTDKAVSKWETGAGCPDVSILGELSEALGVGIGEILNGQYDDKLKDNDKFILDAVNYSKENTTKKIYKRISYFLIITMCVLCCYIIGMEIYQSIWFNKEYEYNITLEYSKNAQDKYSKIIEKMDLIIEGKTNKINEQDDQQIKNSISNLKNSLKDIEPFIKNEKIILSYQDYVNAYTFSNNFLVSPIYLYHFLEMDKELEIMTAYQQTITNLVFDNINKFTSENTYFENDIYYNPEEYHYKTMNNVVDVDIIQSNISNGLNMIYVTLNKLIENGDYYE